mmetsp:Transcript_57324/g.185729  ORF Transcript_57324/g.185729 Transcript_57324/m.185729 type:complete len:206 (+) Transcript_57324:187-804(+)
MARASLDLTSGITDLSSRIALKMMFAQFGEVSACWIPPLENRVKERAFVKFNRPEAAQAALDACKGGQIFLDGVQVAAEWRLTPGKTQDSRDFDAKGSNLLSSRDLMRERAVDGQRGRDRDRRRSQSRGRRKSDRRRSRSRKRSSGGSSSRSSRNRKRRRRSRDKKDSDKKKGGASAKVGSAAKGGAAAAARARSPGVISVGSSN